MNADDIAMTQASDEFKKLANDLLKTSIDFYQDGCQKIYAYVENKFKDKLIDYQRDKLVRAYISEFEKNVIGLFSDLQKKAE